MSGEAAVEPGQELELAFAKASSLQELVALRKRVDLALKGARRHKDSQTSVRLAQLKMRIERRAGELLIASDAEAPTNEEKAKWIAEARKMFSPSRRVPCAVCNRYESLTQAHHIVPLHIQFENGYREADHRHIWLCPTHHAAVHLLISFGYHGLELLGATRLQLIIDLRKSERKKVLDIFKRAWASRRADDDE